MIWLTWRQLRVQAISATAAVAAFAGLLTATGPGLASRYATSGITGCHGFTCGTAVNAFLSQLTGLYPVVYLLGIGLILVAPAITGIFWGAPLVARELETRTFNLAWTQSTTRTRWLAVKLTLTGLAAMAVTEALSLIYTWWADPISKAVRLGSGSGPQMFNLGRFSPASFASHGVTPLGYAAFAFVLGAVAGVLFRRALPAMAVTLAVFAVVQVAMPVWIRPHLVPPSHTTAAIAAADLVYGDLSADVTPGHPGAWILASQALDASGQPVSAIPAACASVDSGLPKGGGATATTPAECMQSRGYREAITYLPTSRYWLLQWIETGIFLTLALALAGICFWRLDRRRN